MVDQIRCAEETPGAGKIIMRDDNSGFCCKKIYRGDIWNPKFEPCGRRAKFQDDNGNWFCGIRSPAAQARRDAKSDAAYEKVKADHAAKAARNAKADKYDAVIVELEAWQDCFNEYEYRAGKIRERNH